jgi:tol-pal system-associated acyl-CoA thioesterase
MAQLQEAAARLKAAAGMKAVFHGLEFPMRVYWEDTDAGGIVFYANYLKFFERARTEWLRSLGIGQQALRDSTGGMFVVTETSVRYHRPARLDDELIVTAQLTESAARPDNRRSRRCGPARTVLCEGTIRIGWVDANTCGPPEFPPPFWKHSLHEPRPVHPPPGAQRQLVVQLVMLLLVLVSVASWAAIFRKLFALKRVKSLNDEFEREFWSGTSLNDLYAAATQNAKQSGPMERIFASGMREYQKLRERRISDPGTLLDGARRAMRASFQREMDVVESNLSFLARSAPSRRMSACSARCGASCTPSPAWPACSR